MENKTARILLVEDEEALADVLEAKLKKEGHELQVSYDGEDGYEQIKNWKPELILLDIVMPKMDGYEVLEKMNEEGIKIPVIIISNSGQPVEIEKTKKLGAIDHLIKTQFDPKEVVDKVQKYLVSSSNNSTQEGFSGSIEEEEDIQPRKEKGAKESVGIKVMLVEDDSFLRDICAKKLSKEGFEVYEAIDGEEALKIVEKVNPDIVLLDIILPAIDGFEVLEKIRSNPNLKTQKVPIIMLSNLGQKDDIEKALKIGANDYLVKAHFNTEEIIEKIKKELGKE
jgi:DNA-binding response OmpR family regulator